LLDLPTIVTLNESFNDSDIQQNKIIPLTS
jgi:hypothetical protein